MKQFIRFLFVGGIAAGANFGSRFLFSLWVNYEIAIILAFFVGLLTGFLLMRKLVFNAKGKALMPQIINFVAINMLALLQTLLISVALVRWLFPEWGIVEQPEAIAHLIGVLAPVVTSYFGHKFLTFK